MTNSYDIWCAYLSGPMTGRPGLNYKEFRRICKKLRSKGITVLNPVELDDTGKKIPAKTKENWAWFVRRDIRELMKKNVDSIILMDGWEQSRGSRGEVFNVINILGGQAFKYDDAENEDGFILTPLTINFTMAVSVDNGTEQKED